MAFHCLLIITAASQVVSVVLLVSIIGRVDASQDVSCNATCEYTAWALDANCRDRGLTEVPPECSQSEMVDLRNNELTSLGARSFRGYRQLRYLDLEFNLIGNVTRGAFDGCVSLLKIYLQFNSLTEVGERAFEGASDLKRLFLNQNDITDIHPDAFGSLGALSGLYFGHNEITSLHASVFRHTPLLQYLHMGNNGLTEFPTGIFDTLTALVYINVENNHLKFLDGSLFTSLANLQELNLTGNLIHSVTSLPTLPNLQILDLFDNELGDASALRDKLDGLKELYLAENRNLSCTCSVDPIREWITDHMMDDDVDTPRANATCGWPQKLRGYPLSHLTRNKLCLQPPKSNFATVQPSAKSTSSQSFVTRDYLIPKAKQNKEQTSENNHFILYISVGSATLFSVVIVLIALVKYLNWHRRRDRQQQQAIKQQQANKQLQRPLEQHQQQHRSLPVVHIIPNRLIQDDEGAYEPVCIRPHSPSDSAFGSQDDVLAAQEREAQSWIDPTYRLPPYGSEDSHDEVQRVYPAYMTMEQWNALHPRPPNDSNFASIEEPPVLRKERKSSNPFKNNVPDHVTTPYIPHVVVYNQTRNGSECDKTHAKQSYEADHIPCQTPEWKPEHTPKHNAAKLLRYSSKNPFQNSPSSNPFINCA